MWQALEELQSEAVNTEQTLTIRMLSRSQGVFPAIPSKITRTGRVGRWEQVGEASEARPTQWGPYCRPWLPRSHRHRAEGRRPQSSNRPVQGEGPEGPPTRLQEDKIDQREYVWPLQTTLLLGGPPCQRKTAWKGQQWRRQGKSMKWDPRSAATSSQVRSVVAISVMPRNPWTHPHALKTLNHKMARSQKQPIHQLTICPFQGGAGWGWLNAGFPSLPSAGLVIQQEETNRKFQQQDNEQKTGAEDLKCLLFAQWPDN